MTNHYPGYIQAARVSGTKMNFRSSGILEVAEQSSGDDNAWLAIAIIVLILIARHLVISFLSQTEKRR